MDLPFRVMSRAQYDDLLTSLWAAERRVAELEGGLAQEQLTKIRELVESESESPRTPIVLGLASVALALVSPVLTVEYDRWRNGPPNQPMPVICEFDVTVRQIADAHNFVINIPRPAGEAHTSYQMDAGATGSISGTDEDDTGSFSATVEPTTVEGRASVIAPTSGTGTIIAEPDGGDDS